MVKQTTFRYNIIFSFLGVVIGIGLAVASIYMQFIIKGWEFGWNIGLTIFFFLFACIFFMFPLIRVVLSSDTLEIWVGRFKRRQIQYKDMKYLTKSVGLLTGYILAYENDGNIKTVFIFLIWRSQMFLNQLKMHCPQLVIK